MYKRQADVAASVESFVIVNAKPEVAKSQAANQKALVSDLLSHSHSREKKKTKRGGFFARLFSWKK